jgi:hypothetical protein
MRVFKVVMIVLLKLALTCAIKPNPKSSLFDTNQIALTASIDQGGAKRRGCNSAAPILFGLCFI